MKRLLLLVAITLALNVSAENTSKEVSKEKTKEVTEKKEVEQEKEIVLFNGGKFKWIINQNGKLALIYE